MADIIMDAIAASAGATVRSSLTETNGPSGRGSIHAVHVAFSIQELLGGLPPCIVALCEALAAAGCGVTLCTSDPIPGWGRPVPVDESLVRLRSFPGRAWDRPRVFFTRGCRRLLRELAGQAGVIHTHCPLTPWTHHGSVVAAQAGVPHVLSCHGMLSPAALGVSSWKKAVAKALYAGGDLKRAACLHALTAKEAGDIRAYGLGNPVAVVPNGVALEAFESLPDRRSAWDRWPELRGRKVITFLGRIHPIKGLPILVEAWAKLAAEFNDWRLVVAGPEELAHAGELRRLAEQAGAADRVSFPGPTFGEDKRALLAATDVFALPSRSEGFSMAILEAMASRRPVVITPQCNLDEAAAVGAGVLAEPNVDAMVEALRAVLALSDADRAAMGERGHDLVAEKFTWRHIAEEMTGVYRWLHDGGPRPACVMLD